MYKSQENKEEQASQYSMLRFYQDLATKSWSIKDIIQIIQPQETKALSDFLALIKADKKLLHKELKTKYKNKPSDEELASLLQAYPKLSDAFNQHHKLLTRVADTYYQTLLATKVAKTYFDQYAPLIQQGASKSSTSFSAINWEHQQLTKSLKSQELWKDFKKAIKGGKETLGLFLSKQPQLISEVQQLNTNKLAPVTEEIEGDDYRSATIVEQRKPVVQLPSSVSQEENVTPKQQRPKEDPHNVVSAIMRSW